MGLLVVRWRHSELALIPTHRRLSSTTRRSGISNIFSRAAQKEKVARGSQSYRACLRIAIKQRSISITADVFRQHRRTVPLRCDLADDTDVIRHRTDRIARENKIDLPNQQYDISIYQATSVRTFATRDIRPLSFTR